MSTLIRAIRAEFAKIFSTRMWWVLAIVLFAYIALLAGGLSGLFGGIESGAIPSRAGGSGQQGLAALGSLPPLIYSFASSVGYVFPVLFGALVVTSEFRHQTLTPTFLATPRRGTVLLAKCVTMFLMGALYGVVALLASVGLGSLILNGFSIDTLLGEPDTWVLFGRVLLAMALWGLIGVGLGVLVPSQVASIVIVIAFTQFVEPLLRVATTFTDWSAEIGKFLPGSASDALVGSSFYSTIGMGGGSVLAWWQGGLVLLGYALITSVIGWLTTWKRDVT